LRIDTETDVPTGLLARTDAAGAIISPSTWQSDTTPYYVFTAAGSTAPIVGYSFGLNAAADCTVDTTATVIDWLNLTEGVNTLELRALDQAGHCGSAVSHTIWADSAAQDIANLRGFTAQDGDAITGGGWQSDNAPYMSWDLPTSAAPISFPTMWASTAASHRLPRRDAACPAQVLTDGTCVLVRRRFGKQLRDRGDVRLRVDTVADSASAIGATSALGGVIPGHISR
jgi:hypothetical protein